ncbi:hypothetical protein [Pseudomonas sp. B392_1p]|uniref:hypothetical protein n=1 Tax=Pseudomonas sp. B392_1p TaxID=3457507 RepID=UPI003FD24B81
MSNQAQVDALEHLLIAILQKSKMTLQVDPAFDAALSSIMGSDGPGGPAEKSAAADYLADIKRRVQAR